MSARKIRRAEAHLARKLARKAGFPAPSPEPAAVPAEARFPEPGAPFPPVSVISPAAAVPGPSSDTQNHPAPAATRHNGTFLVLGNEDAMASKR